MKIKHKLKILFFSKTCKVSDAEQLEAAKIGYPVQFRNSEWDDFEKCDGVAGNIPKSYYEKGKLKVPKAEEAIAKYKKAVEEKIEQVGEVKASKSSKTSKVTEDNKGQQHDQTKPAWNAGNQPKQ